MVQVRKRGRPRKWEPKHGLRMVIRYPNRRLYDHFASDYIKLTKLLTFKKGSFMVLNYVNGKDITTWAIRSAKHEEESADLRREGKKLGIR